MGDRAAHFSQSTREMGHPGWFFAAVERVSPVRPAPGSAAFAEPAPSEAEGNVRLTLELANDRRPTTVSMAQSSSNYGDFCA